MSTGVPPTRPGDQPSRSRGWHFTWWGKILLATGAWLVWAILKVIGSTYRLEVIRGGEHLEEARREKRPFILCFWHNRSFISAWLCLRELTRHGYDLLVLASHSRDGELVTKVAHRFKMSVVRGSSSRGGREAVRAIYRAVTRQGSSPVMIPDGPRGPVYHFKVGVVVLAQLSQVPILPMGMAASRFIRIKSWDRIIVPLPFARVALVVGDPEGVPRGLSSEELEAERLRLEKVLDELTQEAETALGVEDVMRPSSPQIWPFET